MHASRSVETLPPPAILDDIQGWAASHPDELTVRLFVDPKGDAQTSSTVVPRRIDSEAIEDIRKERGLLQRVSLIDWLRGRPAEKNEQKKVLFAVCGPEP